MVETSAWEVVVVGAGAAGLLAAARAAERGRRTLLLEKNRRPGVKILMSGGTRCNLTHAVEARGIIEAFGPPGRFLHSALSALGPRDLVDLIEAEGVPTKVEATGKIFPASDQASDVLQALRRRLSRSGCALALREPLLAVERTSGGFRLITPSRALDARKVILTPGGQSYPGCGTTGDGYAWAARLGHTVLAPRPALVPLVVNLAWVQALKGVSVNDVRVRVLASGSASCLAERRGSFLFTHFGLSGPAVLDASRAVSAYEGPGTPLLECDFLPAARTGELDQALKQQALSAGRRRAGGVLEDALPRRLGEALVRLAGIPPEQRTAELSRAQRQGLVQAVQAQKIPVTGTLGFKKAEVTAGGVCLDEVVPRTLESRIVPGLHLAGEILDLDGPIGGYNFQAAFSTGWLAGESV